MGVLSGILTTQSGTYDVRGISGQLTKSENVRLLFIHAFMACDTVSGIYGYGKPKSLKTLSNATDLDNVFQELLFVKQ